MASRRSGRGGRPGGRPGGKPMADMKRRGSIVLIGGAAAWPLAARAQQPAMPVVGFLSSASPEAFAPYLDAFRLGLEQAGFVEDRNFTIVYCWARGRDDRLPALAAELVERKVAVIAASGEPAGMAGKAATAATPIILLLDGDPVLLGFGPRLHRPRFPARPDRRARRALWRPGDVRTARFRGGGRLDELWHVSSRLVSQAGRVYRARSQGDEHG